LFGNNRLHDPWQDHATKPGPAQRNAQRKPAVFVKAVDDDPVVADRRNARAGDPGGDEGQIQWCLSGGNIGYSGQRQAIGDGGHKDNAARADPVSDCPCGGNGDDQAGQMQAQRRSRLCRRKAQIRSNRCRCVVEHRDHQHRHAEGYADRQDQWDDRVFFW
jgi:hypothetical protein